MDIFYNGGVQHNNPVGNGLILPTYTVSSNIPPPSPDYMVSSPIQNGNGTGIVNVPYNLPPPPASGHTGFASPFTSPYSSNNNNTIPNNGFPPANGTFSPVNNVPSPTGSPSPPQRPPQQAAITEQVTNVLQTISAAAASQQVKLAAILKQQLSVIGKLSISPNSTYFTLYSSNNSLEHQIHLTNQGQLWGLANDEDNLYVQIDQQLRALSTIPQQAMLSPSDMFRVRLTLTHPFFIMYCASIDFEYRSGS